MSLNLFSLPRLVVVVQAPLRRQLLSALPTLKVFDFFFPLGEKK